MDEQITSEGKNQEESIDLHPVFKKPLKTPLLLIFLILPIITFFFGMIFQKSFDLKSSVIKSNSSKTSASNSSQSATEQIFENTQDYKVVLDLYPEHSDILDDEDGYLQKLTDAYNAYADLVGKTPFDGKTITLKEGSDEELKGAALLSGNPIYWSHRYLPNDLEKINNENDLSFGPIHELGHDFDIYFSSNSYLIGQSKLLNAEQWANFKLTYVADTLAKKYPDATFYQGQVGFLPIGEFSQKYFYDIFAKNWLASPSGEWDTMENDVFTGLLYSLTKKYGWEPFKKTFRDYNTFNVIIKFPPLNDIGKLQLFADTLSKYAGSGVKKDFQNWGIPIE